MKVGCLATKILRAHLGHPMTWGEGAQSEEVRALYFMVVPRREYDEVVDSGTFFLMLVTIVLLINNIR